MNIHICFYDGSDQSTIKIINSLSKNANVDLIIVMAERSIILENLEKKSGILYKFEHKAIITDDYDDIIVNLSSIITDYKERGHQLFINITASTPLQAFAARYASLQSPVPTYYIDERNILRLIRKELIPDEIGRAHV